MIFCLHIYIFTVLKDIWIHCPKKQKSWTFLLRRIFLFWTDMLSSDNIQKGVHVSLKINHAIYHLKSMFSIKSKKMWKQKILKLSARLDVYTLDIHLSTRLDQNYFVMDCCILDKIHDLTSNYADQCPLQQKTKHINKHYSKQ